MSGTMYNSSNGKVIKSKKQPRLRQSVEYEPYVKINQEFGSYGQGMGEQAEVDFLIEHPEYKRKVKKNSLLQDKNIGYLYYKKHAEQNDLYADTVKANKINLNEINKKLKKIKDEPLLTVRNNKKQLLEYGGFNNINEAKKQLNAKASDIYEYLLNNYDDIRNKINKNNEENKKILLEDSREIIKKVKENKKRYEKENQIVKNYFEKKTLELSELNNKNDGTVMFLLNTRFPFNIDVNTYLITFIKTSREILHGKKLLLNINGKGYTLSNNFIQKLEEVIKKAVDGYVIDHRESDGRVVGELRYYDSFSIRVIEDAHKYKKATGEFFKYYHNLNLDLTKYGIYKNNEEFHSVEDRDICLIHSLKEGGISKEKIERLRSISTHSNIPLCKLNEICNELKIRIEITRETKNAGRDIYGKEFEEVYKIGLLDEHYFILNDSSVNTFAINNYDDICNLENWCLIGEKVNDKYILKKGRSISSYKLIKMLLEQKERFLTLIPFNDICSTSYHKRFDNEITNLDYNIDSLTEVEKPDSDLTPQQLFIKRYKIVNNIFFDFETFNDLITNKTKPYLCCIQKEDIKKSFVGYGCALEMLEYLNDTFSRQEIQLIAHNASFDFRFIVKYLSQFEEISKGTRLITGEGRYKTLTIKIKCSYHLISVPLKKFGKMFKLEQGKEIIPYDLYNEVGAIDKKYINIEYVLNKYISEKDKEQFLKNIEKWNLRIGDYYDIIEYSKKYCEIDCDVLEKGYNIFRKWILDLRCYNYNDKLINPYLDINNILTSASLAHRYMLEGDCYRDVYNMKGTPQQFIQKCVVGGRTMMRNNQKDLIDGSVRPIADFDGVSLYPSAMARMCGFLKGKPKVLNRLDYDFINNYYCGYFVKIHIHNIPIKRSFPLASYINENGIRMFENHIKNDIYVDKIQLQDLIKFHGLRKEDFSIIQGYGFNEGCNKQINKNITYLFNKRKELKRNKNPAETIYKLIMNSAYGKSIMKEIINEYKIFDDKKDYDVYVSRNYEWIEEIIPIEDCDKMKVKIIKPVNNHFNICHIGASVLSWSKRIMNEVMCLAEDNNISIFYQDTDSMHMYKDDIPRLGDLFRKEYRRDLIGEELGQFHSDFDIEGCKNVYSTKLITLGKKSYCDVLVGTNNKGEEVKDYHIRMKGIPNSCLTYTQKLHGYAKIVDMYEDLYNGKPILFDLTEGMSKVIFKMNSNYSINTQTSFTRLIKF
jgi:hypothetical protein